MNHRQINELIAYKLFGIKRVYYPDWAAGKTYGGDWPMYIPSGKPWRTHSIDGNPLPQCTKSIDAAFQAIDKLIEIGHGNFRLVHVCCVDGFAWAAEINGPYDNDLGGKPFYGGAGPSRQEAICSMIVKVLEAFPL